jgi:hypothetical protein
VNVVSQLGDNNNVNILMCNYVQQYIYNAKYKHYKCYKCGLRGHIASLCDNLCKKCNICHKKGICFIELIEAIKFLQEDPIKRANKKNIKRYKKDEIKNILTDMITYRNNIEKNIEEEENKRAEKMIDLDAVNLEASNKAYEMNNNLGSTLLTFIGKSKPEQYVTDKAKIYREEYMKQFETNKNLLKSCRPANIAAQLELRSQLLEEQNKINKIMNKLRGDIKYITKELNAKIDEYKNEILRMAEKEKYQYEMAKKNGKLAVYNYKMLKTKAELAATDCKKYAAEKQKQITQLFNLQYSQANNNATRDKYITIGYSLLTKARNRGIQSAIEEAKGYYTGVNRYKNSGLIRDANKDNIEFIVSRVSYYKQISGGKWEQHVDKIRKEISQKWHQRYD